MQKNILNRLIKRFFALPANKSKADLGYPRKILIVRQHNQLGDMLATVSLFKALKRKFPKAVITLIVSPANCMAVAKNKYIDRYFIYDKNKLFNPAYLLRFWKLIKEDYDVAIVPCTVSISFTSNFIARLSNSKTRIGVSKLNGMVNEYAYLFDRRIIMDWRKHPDCNVSAFCLEILKDFDITTNDYSSEITFDKSDIKAANEFLKTMKHHPSQLLIGLHAGAGKPPNRWSLKKYAEVMEKLHHQYKANFYLTGTSADEEEIHFLKKNLSLPVGLFINKPIPEVAALISKSDLFITNDTGIMHVAGATKTPQISIFGPTNPFNWAPVGKNKPFLWKSDLIDDITVDDVLNLSRELLSDSKKIPKLVKPGN